MTKDEVADLYPWMLMAAKRLRKGAKSVDPEDMAQEAAVELLSRPELDINTAKAAATNAMKDHMARFGFQRRSGTRTVRLNRVEMSHKGINQVADRRDGPGMVFWDSLPLTDTEREILRLSIEQNKTSKDIATELGMPSSTTNLRLRQALAKLKKIKAHDGEELTGRQLQYRRVETERPYRRKAATSNAA